MPDDPSDSSRTTWPFSLRLDIPNHSAIRPGRQRVFLGDTIEWSLFRLLAERRGVRYWEPEELFRTCWKRKNWYPVLKSDLVNLRRRLCRLRKRIIPLALGVQADKNMGYRLVCL
jgi:hypothetical protein